MTMPLPSERAQLTVTILLYDRMTALDAIGPYEVLRCVPGVRVQFVAKRAGIVVPDSGLQLLNAERSIADVSETDVLLIPGGDPAVLVRDPEIVAWVRRIHATTTWTTSVCVGSLVLGAAGLLAGLEATTHWAAHDVLRKFGATPVHRRVVRQGKIITAAGISAGIDMALALVALTHGEDVAKTVQLLIEYDPEPPFASGSVENAAPATVAAAREILRAMYA
jgi:transcriptional regulator GlxA family with amidase domain